MKKIPKKLRNDAIVEAMCEIRFDCVENREAPEIVVGILASNAIWRGLSKRRLPEADIPQQIRSMDPDLRVRPTLELVDKSQNRHIRIGSHSISTSRKGGYPGWPVMQKDVAETVACLFASLEELSIFRIGLRYVNVLEPGKHGLSSIHELRFRITVDDDHLDGGVNLNFIKTSDDHISTVRIASPEFVHNLDPGSGLGVIDIDTATSRSSQIGAPKDIEEWCEQAHDLEKTIFFSLFEESALDSIVEEWK